MGTIFNAGGEIGVFNTTFEGNTVKKYAVFTTVNNGHAYLGFNTKFIHNEAALGPVFISSESFLQYSLDATGNNNTGGCDSIYIEDDGASCFFPRGTACTGTCCEFDDVLCDLHPDPELDLTSTSMPTSSPVSKPVALTSSPTVVPVANNPDADEESLGPDEGSPDPDEESSSNSELTDSISNQIQIESPTDVSSNRSCTGFCIATAVTVPLFAIFILVPLFACLRKRKTRKDVDKDTQNASDIDDNSHPKEVEIS